MTTQKLSFEQVKRMSEVIGSNFSVHAFGDFPNLDIKPEELVLAIRERLSDSNILMKDVRINGRCASVIVGAPEKHTFNDLDILFNMKSHPPSNQMGDRARHDFIRKCVLETLVNFLPDSNQNGNIINKSLLNLERLAEEYIQKYICVQNGSNDLWSLITLRNVAGRNIELKFVNSMKRKYEFSIDSFQLIINEYLAYLETSSQPISLNFFPCVNVESVFGDIETALTDLEKGRIRTKNPEEIRGGGLLKYCFYISSGYTDADPHEPNTNKKYMCTRFFIDFSDLQHQQLQLENFLANHFSRSDISSKSCFLHIVYGLIKEHASCLSSRQCNRSLSLVHDMELQYKIQKQQNSPVNFAYVYNNYNMYNINANFSNNTYNNICNIYSNNNNTYNVYNNAFNNVHLSFYTPQPIPQQPVIQS